MEDNRWSDRAIYFFLGASLGAVAALLFAPKSGPETREIIVTKAKDLKDGLKDYIHKGKEMLSHEKEVISHAIEAGKQAYKEERATKKTE